MTPGRAAAAIAARHQATQGKLQQVRDAIATLRRAKARLTYPAIARQAGVSRTFLYENPDAKALISQALSKASGQQAPGRSRAGRDDQESPWRERALNAEAALQAAETEIRAQRHRMAILMGQIRDLEQDLPKDTAQRITTENTTLKQRVRQLTHDNRTLEERLEAARSNARFADRRIAQLEAQLIDHPAGRA